MKKRIDFSLYKKEPPKTLGGGVISGPLQNAMSISNELSEVMQLFDQDKTIWWVSNGDWSMHEMLLAIMERTGAAHVTISSYAMGETPARILAQLKNQGLITSLKCVLDDRIDVRTPGSLQLIKSIADQFCLCKTHAKVTLVENESWKVMVMGSANYTVNKRFESGVITTDLNGYNKNSTWITNALRDGNNQ